MLNDRILAGAAHALAAADGVDQTEIAALLRFALHRSALPDEATVAEQSDRFANAVKDGADVSSLAKEIAAPYQALLQKVQVEDATPDAETAQITATRIEGYLRGRADTRWHRKVQSVTHLQGGFSKETLLVAFAEGTESLVLRKFVDGVPPTGLNAEWQVVCHAFAMGLPVAEPYWLEEDATKLGNSFFASAMMKGNNLGDVWGSVDAVEPTAAIDLACAMGALHSAPVPDGLAPPTQPMASIEDITNAIRMCEGMVGPMSKKSEPLYCGLVEWLKAHQPPPPAQPRLLHGDIGFHNMLIADGRVTVILDWERSHLGDPAEELAYVRGTLEGIIPWAEFLSHYQAAGGVVPEEANLKFWQVWADVWRASACLMLRMQFETMKAPRLSDAVAGLVFGPRFTLSAARTAFGL